VAAAAVVVVLLLLLVLVRAPCVAGGRPVREGVGNGTATAPVLDVDRRAAGTHAHRVATVVGGGAPTPPSGPSQNHN
jgi:hypothetical protein